MRIVEPQTGEKIDFDRRDRAAAGFEMVRTICYSSDRGFLSVQIGRDDRASTLLAP